MKVALITEDFYPIYGGIAHTMINLCKFFKEKEDTLYIINPYYQGKNIANILDNHDYNLRDILFNLKKRNLIQILISSIWKTITDNRLTYSDRLMVVIFYFLKPKLSVRLFKNLQNIYPYLKKKNVDIILGGSLGTNTTLLLYLLSRILGEKKFISMAYGNDFLIQYPISVKSIGIKTLDKVIICSDAMKQLIKKIQKIEENRLIVINRALNLKDLEIKESKQDLRSKFDISNDEFIILSVGRHVPRKRFDLVIKALGAIKGKDPSLKIKYYLIGEGQETRNLKELVSNLHLQDSVVFVGACDYDTRNRYYKLSDVFIMPSIAQKNSIEGFGIVFLEANFYKLPTIGSFSGGVVEAIIDKKTGFLVKPDDLNDLVEKILLIVKNKEYKLEMGEFGHKRVVNEFNWAQIINEYIKTFMSVL